MLKDKVAKKAISVDPLVACKRPAAVDFVAARPERALTRR